MCGLCGMLAGRGHWTESTSSPEVFAGREQAHTGGRERQQRVRLLNRILAHYRLRVTDWTPGACVLRGATGRSVIVGNLSELWAAAESLAGSPCDPLDAGLLASIGAGDARGSSVP